MSFFPFDAPEKNPTSVPTASLEKDPKESTSNQRGEGIELELNIRAVYGICLRFLGSMIEIYFINIHRLQSITPKNM